MNDLITILLVDDHEVVRHGVRTLLEAHDEFQVVGEANDGAEAIKLAGEFVPDVVLMDLIMPGMDGVEATRLIKKVSPRTQIVVLTSYHEDEHIFPAFKAGALSYLLKDVKMDELIETVKKAALSEAVLHSHVAVRVIDEIQGGKENVYNPHSDLTNREMEILKMIAAGSNNSEIAEQLVISMHTVKGHVSNILSKLHLADRTQAAVYAWQKGVVHRD